MSIINKIWSEHSLLNNNYTNSLVKQAIDHPEQRLDVNEQLLGDRKVTQLSSKGRISLFFQKLSLTLGLIVPGLHQRIIKAFSKVEGLTTLEAQQYREKMHDYQKQIKEINENEAKTQLKGLTLALENLEQKCKDNHSLQLEKATVLSKNQKELETLERKKIEIPQKLAIISSYLELKQTAEEHLQAKIKSKSLFTREATVRKEAENEEPALNVKAKEKELEDNRIPANNLTAYQKELEQSLQNMPSKIEEKKEQTEISERELEAAKASLAQLVEEKAKLEKEKAAVMKWLQPRVQETQPSTEQPAVVEEKRAEGASQVAEDNSQRPIKEQMLLDIQTYIHEDIATVWRGVFDKFTPDNVKMWSCDAEGNFKLELKGPMRMWMPSKDESGKQDPPKGVVLTLGLDEKGHATGVVTGKFNRETKDMAFSEGMNFFVRPDESKASPGFINLTHIRYDGQAEIHIITNKDLRKDFNWILLPIVGAIAAKYGTVDKNYNLIVDKKRTFSNMVENWNTEGKAVDNERIAVGLN